VPSAQDIEHCYERYVAAWSRHDVDAVVALFASDAVVHDPVDSPPLEGVDKIREFFAQGVGGVRVFRL
jgi:steroid delta-isomerase